MHFPSAFTLFLIALSGTFVACSPTTRGSRGTGLQGDGDILSLTARDPVRHPGGTGVGLVRFERSFVPTKRDSLAPRNAVVGGLDSVISYVISGLADDKIARQKFTERFIQLVRQDYPQFNWVICHVNHTTQFDGNQDEDWGHRHQEFDVKIGGDIGYDIYWFKSGTFVRLGDPGYMNWAYDGKILSQVDTENGSTVVFGVTDGLAPGRIPNSDKRGSKLPPRLLMISTFLTLATFSTF